MNKLERDYQKDLEICKKATPGPWESLHGGEDLPDKIITPCTGEWSEEIAVELLRVNAEFITMSREALPYYITKCQQLEKLAEELFSVYQSSCAWRILRIAGDDPTKCKCRRTMDKCSLGTCFYYGGIA